MPCNDAHLPVSLHQPIRTAAVAQVSANSATLNSVQLPALPTGSLEALHSPKKSTTLLHSVTELFQHPHQTPSWPHWTPYP